MRLFSILHNKWSSERSVGVMGWRTWLTFTKYLPSQVNGFGNRFQLLPGHQHRGHDQQLRFLVTAVLNTIQTVLVPAKNHQWLDWNELPPGTSHSAEHSTNSSCSTKEPSVTWLEWVATRNKPQCWTQYRQFLFVQRTISDLTGTSCHQEQATVPNTVQTVLVRPKNHQWLDWNELPPGTSHSAEHSINSSCSTKESSKTGVGCQQRQAAVPNTIQTVLVSPKNHQRLERAAIRGNRRCQGLATTPATSFFPMQTPNSDKIMN